MLSRRAKCWLSFTSSASASLPPFCLWLLTTEPNRRYASVLKFLIVFVSVVAIARRLMP